MTMKAKTAVVCLGNELIGDDGIGIRVGRVLEKLPLPASVHILFRPSLGLDLLELLDQFGELVVVDAMVSGREAGTCLLMNPRQAANLATKPWCAHGLGIAEVLQFAHQQSPESSSQQVRILGIEAKVMDRYEIGLSEPVKKALPYAVAMVLEALNCTDLDEKEVQRIAENEAQTVVSLDHLIGADTASR
jgi:hydrogenase maturation protease